MRIGSAAAARCSPMLQPEKLQGASLMLRLSRPPSALWGALAPPWRMQRNARRTSARSRVLTRWACCSGAAVLQCCCIAARPRGECEKQKPRGALGRGPGPARELEQWGARWARRMPAPAPSRVAGQSAQRASERAAAAAPGAGHRCGGEDHAD